MSVYKEILQEALTKGPGLNIYIILFLIPKEEIKILGEITSFLVPVLTSGPSSYLKKRYSLKLDFANRMPLLPGL
jgi:hypothetical protein